CPERFGHTGNRPGAIPTSARCNEGGGIGMMQNGGFVLGGVPAKQLGIIMISSSRRPILPSTVDRTMPIPGRHGAWDFGADLGPRQFALDCALIEQDAVALQLAVEQVAALLLEKHGRPRERALRLELRP